jgi:hypothetical protein
MNLEELIKSVSQIKLGAHQLSQMIAISCSELQKQATHIQALTRGSKTGENAARQVLLASKSLTDSTLSLIALNNAIDNFVQERSL